MSRRRVLVPFLLALLAPLACHRVRPPAIPPRVSGEFPEGYRTRPGRTSPVFPHAVIASESRLASEAGLEMLRAGGNAIDAAVATGFALAVAYPEAGNLGGGGFMLVRLADGRTFALDYREVAPAAATRQMFVDSAGRVVPGLSTRGWLASGVPGSVAGLVTAQARFGKLSLERVLAPAIRLADSGIVVDSSLVKSLRENRNQIAPFAGAERFLPGGEPLAVGTVLRQPELGRTLRRIAEHGAEGFYRGETAEAIAEEMRRHGGIVTTEDLARYRPEWRTPIETRYRGYTLLGMPPASSGGVTIAEVLGVLATWDAPAPFGSTAWAHRLGSAYQRAFIDRNTRLGDPAFVQVPIGTLTSEAHARALRGTIDEQRAVPTATLAGTLAPPVEGMHTTHYSVADAHGNVVATTTTLNDLYGSGVYVTAAGFFLNDEMDDFTASPGVPNMFGLVQGEQNAVAPGKRPLSAMSPTIVLDTIDQPLLALGSRGGPRIISSASQVILDVIDYRMTIADAVVAPRVHHQATPDVLVVDPNGLRPAVEDSLRAMGWTVKDPQSAIHQDYIGLPVAVMRTAGGWTAAVDARRGEGIVGY